MKPTKMLRRAARTIVENTPLRDVILTEPRFVIVGTGRSGTGYIAALLTEAGVRCGHEGWWNPKGHHKPFLKGDASWCAIFCLDGYQGRILHQVRDPIKVISSLVRVEAGPEQRSLPHGQYRAKWVDFTGDRIVDAMTIADTWIRKAEEVAHHTYRLEDLRPELVVHLLNFAGFDVPTGDIEEAFLRVPSTFNTKATRQSDRGPVVWNDLPDGKTKARLRVHADKYGYL